MATPYATVALDTVQSTQDEARHRLGDRPGAVLVVAAEQTSGRGRTGRVWVSAPRAVAASLALRPSWSIETWPRLTLAAGLAAADATERVTGTGVWLKWPNDVVTADGAKLGGLLAESRDDVVVVGLGLNLFWPDPPAAAGALLDSDPGPGLARTIATAWADELLLRVDTGPRAWGVDQYRRRCVTLGADITWEPAGVGRAVDVDGDGRLLVETAGGPVLLAAGEVHQVRPGRVPPR